MILCSSFVCENACILLKFNFFKTTTTAHSICTLLSIIQSFSTIFCHQFHKFCKISALQDHHIHKIQHHYKMHLQHNLIISRPQQIHFMLIVICHCKCVTCNMSSLTNLYTVYFNISKTIVSLMY